MFYIHNPTKSFLVNLANIYILRNSLEYKKQDYKDERKYGSRDRFHTDCHINGEYFRSLSNNQYYRVIDKNDDPKTFHCYHPSTELYRYDFDETKHKLIRLEMVNNKKYWIERSQIIQIDYDDVPDFVIVDIPIKDLIVPDFVPVPHQEDCP